MIYSTDRILTAHAGSLPRPDDLREMVLAKARGEPVDQATLDARLLPRRSGWEDHNMGVRRVVPDLGSTSLEAAKGFYGDLLGLRPVMDHG